MNSIVLHTLPSHVYDGCNKNGSGCLYLVANSSDQCAAGHPNKVRIVPVVKPWAGLAALSKGGMKIIGPASFEIDAIPGPNHTSFRMRFDAWCPNKCGTTLEDSEKFDGKPIAWCPTCAESIESGIPLKTTKVTLLTAAGFTPLAEAGEAVPEADLSLWITTLLGTEQNNSGGPQPDGKTVSPTGHTGWQYAECGEHVFYDEYGCTHHGENGIVDKDAEKDHDPVYEGGD